MVQTLKTTTAEDHDQGRGHRDESHPRRKMTSAKHLSGRARTRAGKMAIATRESTGSEMETTTAQGDMEEEMIGPEITTV
jgi:hypothetical protein